MIFIMSLSFHSSLDQKTMSDSDLMFINVISKRRWKIDIDNLRLYDHMIMTVTARPLSGWSTGSVEHSFCRCLTLVVINLRKSLEIFKKTTETCYSVVVFDLTESFLNLNEYFASLWVYLNLSEVLIFSDGTLRIEEYFLKSVVHT